ncbi:hypothetical protein L3X38_020385 [Prunus dulcis]|uniref:Uncharacterized protein n=1 Tax=Prunus dulcis TaxID=3755 RepID=A0AAD4WDG9_PRUDU|nr:hypothetical protein L3X38_020385 [Prunus dulcis]
MSASRSALLKGVEETRMEASQPLWRQSWKKRRRVAAAVVGLSLDSAAGRVVRVSRDVRKTMRNATMVPFACFAAAAAASARRNKMSLKKEDREKTDRDRE